MGIFANDTTELLFIVPLCLLCEALLYAFQVWANRQPGDPLAVRSDYSAVLSLILSWVCILILGGAWIHENARMTEMASYQHETAVEMGAQLFGQYCVPCHGPLGEGHIGYPLDVKYLQGDPVQDKAIYDFLTTTIAEGRNGYATPTWVARPDGHWQSETQMPTWSQDLNGPLDKDQINDLVLLIMDGKHWRDVAQYIPQPGPIVNVGSTDPKKPPTWPKSSLPQDQQLKAEQTIEQIGCMNCHVIGTGGQHIGPDITDIKDWGKGLSEAQWKQFIYDWIADPKAVSDAQRRAPTFWSPYFAHEPGKYTFGDNPAEQLPPTFMPKYDMTPEQRQLIVDYLFSFTKK